MAIRSCAPHPTSRADERWAAVLIALIGLAGIIVGAAATFGTVWVQERRRQAAEAANARERAYLDLLTASLSTANRVRTLITTLKVRTGLTEGLSVVARLRKPIDTFELHDWLDIDFRPLMDAWSRVWVSGTPRGVALGNKVLDASMQIISVLDMPASGETNLRAWLSRTFRAVSTEQLIAEFETHLASLALARRDMANLVRSETGRSPAELFSARPAPGVS